MKKPLPSKRFDERDTMFARMARKSGTPEYDEYYKLRPGLKRKDDRLRALTPLLQQGGKYFKKSTIDEARKYFYSIDKIHLSANLINAYTDQINHSKNITKTLKNIILELGAVSVGITKLDPQFIYNRKGRLDPDYGKKIKLEHNYAVVFLVEMDFNAMQKAPKAATILESAKQYYKAAYISLLIEKVLYTLGNKAKAHYDAHYDVILPPLAIQAGLGELGRNNILITNKYGSRVRIGAITTSLNLKVDAPSRLGVDKFCEICKKCSANCPSKALSFKGQTSIRGIKKWTTNVESCYALWRNYGTDCGICMAVCPFSHKNNLFHNLVRSFVKNLPIFNRILVALDELFYGKKWKNKI